MTLFLTGAGLSAASGIPTFRGAGGLYEGADAVRLASPEGFAEAPGKVWRWYACRIGLVLESKPNKGHAAIAEWPAEKVVITSNVDDLHERAGATACHLHGEILRYRCTACAHEGVWKTPPHDTPHCSCGALLRPCVVWFGERPNMDAFTAFESALGQADTVMEVGVSGAVSYGLTEAALQAGKRVVRINPEPSPLDRYCEAIHEPAETALPRLSRMMRT